MSKSTIVGLIWSLTCIAGAVAAHIFGTSEVSEIGGQKITLPIGILILGAPGILPFFLPYIGKAWAKFRGQ